ncbi:MAG: hypothetical protein SGI74_09965 [Oligoflexia bacterium]|nr:hypothetical protein [Oligoflexia bacterium]
MTAFESILEKLIQHFTGTDYQKEILEGKREFFERAGIIDEESVNFETRMSQFLDWYMFSRDLSEMHIPPVNYYFEQKKDTLPADELGLYENLTKSHHSLFEFLKLRDSDVTIRDLFSKNKYVLLNSPITAGFNADEVFEARLIPFEKTWVFTHGFCFHPVEATKFISKEIKQVRHLDQSHKEALMLKLLKMRYKFEQYKHIRLDFIYSNDGKLRI